MKIGQPLRLRSIKYKDGRASLRVMHSRTPEEDRADVEYFVRKCLDGHNDRIVGFAIVVWAPDMASTALLKSMQGSTIPAIMVPDFVRNRLLAAKIDEWTVSGLRDSGQIY